ncbi:YjgN family protein [Chitinophaga rhizophila]|uniref:DUF898 domain-containing protein n=1 Tax=Chitinophaga rhizophila TaxID=2866212 RepID=A0ABS7G5J1_9BACT|nr:YjgN family protein [Chitinophaga rhizophila]MBW8682899.1 DUF898 domain-containing protein [Chitinophaga rhizophila]
MQQQHSPSGFVSHRPALTYNGDGGTYFGILLVNALLTTVTLGFYYPWAKAKKLQYVYSSTELDGSRFAWHGTGNEMFKGFLKTLAVLAAFFGARYLLDKIGLGIITPFLTLAVVALVVPFAIHSSNRYHWSRTSWRGIRFGYRGDRKELSGIFLGSFALTVVTLGIYSSWMAINMRNYVLSKIRFGSGEFKYEGRGGEYFALNLKGFILTFLTLGIYSFWWQADQYRYLVDNLSLEHEGKSFRLRSTAEGTEFAGLLIVNAILLVFTLGLAFAWVETRTMSFLMSHVEIEGDIELSQLAQTEEEYRDAMGEDMADLLDINVI